MSQPGPETTEQVRAAEVIASMCLATDLGMGFPFEHGLQATLVTKRLCDAVGVDEDVLSPTYYACLLMYAGCTVDEIERSAIFASSMTEHHTHRQFGTRVESLSGVVKALQSPEAALPQRAWQVVTGLPRAARFVDRHFAALCEVAGMLAERLGMPESVHGIFPLLTERWDGNSILERASGDEIPLPLRIIQVGRDAAYQRLIGDDEYVKDVIRSRAGKAFDPDVVAMFLSNTGDILGPPEPPTTAWEDVLASEPQPWLTLEGPAIERALRAMGAFSDLVSPYLLGHSSGVADLAGAAAELGGFTDGEVRTIRRAGFVHDVGRTAVSSRIWNKPGPLTTDERERARLHPYHTERVLARSPFLAEVSSVAMAHHERLDGSGYYRGLDISSFSPASRLLAVADAFQSKIEPRPYRDATSPEKATEILVDKAKRGAFDPANLPQDGRPPHPEQLSQDRRLVSGGRHPFRHRERVGYLIAEFKYGEYSVFTARDFVPRFDACEDGRSKPRRHRGISPRPWSSSTALPATRRGQGRWRQWHDGWNTTAPEHADHRRRSGRPGRRLPPIAGRSAVPDRRRQPQDG